MSTLLVQHGSVLNDRADAFHPADILINDGRIVEVGTGVTIPDAGNCEILDASGLYVAPAFIDMHCHIFKHPLFASGRLEADRIGIRQGVGCLLDTGSAGPQMIDAFKTFVIDTQQTRCFALCNVGSPGQPGISGGHSSRPELVSLAGTVAAIERHPDWILGVKVLASASHTGLMGLEAVKIGRKAADLTGTPLMVHLGNAPPLIDDVLPLLRPGDIVTHAYHGKVGGVLGYGGKVIDAFREAVARGVWVDIAHGRSSFSFDTCAAALDQGMPVHTISSDLHGGNINRYVVSLARTMSKFRTLGLGLAEVVKAVTLTPQSVLGLDRFGYGPLQPGVNADLTLFRETDQRVDMEDAEGKVKVSSHWIEPVSTIVDGELYEVTEAL